MNLLAGEPLPPVTVNTNPRARNTHSTSIGHEVLHNIDVGKEEQAKVDLVLPPARAHAPSEQASLPGQPALPRQP